ncbi:unnamed protein product [Spirodela intermedia]|uniref:Uncharacterized protein n=1 Tax=Spirodela intermedia TaxID=51605 RepID=A0A7I8IKC4_SPIIN|nr:unnamed protein product [Spirodela intermedia]CAA6658338.1 unnamed protein product [Spirodela intermedia]
MGAGGRMFAEEESRPLSRYSNKGKRKGFGAVHRFPAEKPPFTLGDLKRAIPPHCFERSALRSFSHLARDLILSATLLYLAISFIPLLPSRLQIVAWPVYWAAQGAVLTALWILGHECGHNAFSPYSLSTTSSEWCSTPLSSSLTSPGSTATATTTPTQQHRPRRGVGPQDQAQPVPPGQVPEQPPRPCRRLAGRAHGRLAAVPGLQHREPLLRPFCQPLRSLRPIYNDRERTQVIISDLGVLATVALLLKLCAAYSPAAVVGLYVLPWMVANGFIVWEWFKGALATVDRDFGPVLNKVLHNFTETHVAHHLFSKMPHYHALEATRAIRPILGEYYQFDRTPVLKAMWREANECLFVQPDQGSDKSGVFWYSNKL